MKIIAFITEHATVARILEHIRMPAQRPEPSLPGKEEALAHGSRGGRLSGNPDICPEIV